MKPRTDDPRKLDVARAAADGAVLSGRCPVSALERLADGTVLADDDSAVAWTARFERRPVRGGEPEVWLALQAGARVWRECQRCLQPVALELAVDRSLRFVADEATAAALDAESEVDVLAMGRRFDLLELVEDELLLALPLVPMHDTCPVPLGPPEPAADAGPEAPARPFAALAALKRGPSS
jgi:uncharacterized protein